MPLRISQVHVAALSSIVQQTCRKRGVHDVSHRSLRARPFGRVPVRRSGCRAFYKTPMKVNAASQFSVTGAYDTSADTVPVLPGWARTTRCA